MNPHLQEGEYAIEHFTDCLVSGLPPFSKLFNNCSIKPLSNRELTQCRDIDSIISHHHKASIMDHLLIELSIFLIVVLSKEHKSKSSVVSVSSKRPVVSRISAILCSRLESFSATRRLYSWIKFSDEEFRCPLLACVLSLTFGFGLQVKIPATSGIVDKYGITIIWDKHKLCS